MTIVNYKELSQELIDEANKNGYHFTQCVSRQTMKDGSTKEYTYHRMIKGNKRTKLTPEIRDLRANILTAIRKLNTRTGSDIEKLNTILETINIL